MNTIIVTALVAKRARRRAARPIRPPPEPPVPHELVREAGIGGVATARVGYHVDGGAADALGLRPRARGCRGAEELAIRRAADERHHGRLDQRDRAGQALAAARVV